MIYQVTGLHCRECAKDLEEKINHHQNDDYVQVDYENKKINISGKADIGSLEKILDFKKIVYTKDPENVSLNESTEKQGHSHGHTHGDMSEKNMGIVFFLNAIFAVAEFIFGNLFNSTALLADAVHDTGDATSIGLAWFFEKISKKEADEEYSFGYQRFSPLGAIVTSLVLIGGSIIMIFHSIPEVMNPTPINYQGLLWVSIIAIGIKLYAMYLMSKGRSQNEKLMNLHMLEDVFGWAAVLGVSIILHFTDWYILDPLLSIGIAIYILYEAFPMFIDTVKIFLETTPEGMDLQSLEKNIKAIDLVDNVSHLHVWTFDGEENILVVTISTHSDDAEVHTRIKSEIRENLYPYQITHSTIEIVVDESKLLNNI